MRYACGWSSPDRTGPVTSHQPEAQLSLAAETFSAPWRMMCVTIYHKKMTAARRDAGSAPAAAWMALLLIGMARASQPALESSTVLWYKHPAERWENALPVGNGRLGAMVFGATSEELIQLNEDTYWTGGPYSTVVRGGREALPEIQRLIFAGEYRQAHVLFGRRMMGYPVEQQKYQALANLVLSLPARGDVSEYRRQLDLDTAVVTTTYVQGGVRFTREVFASPVHQVVIVHITADRPGRISFSAQLRGCRNTADSNYATDYFRMDGYGSDGLVLRGKSADYMGVAGKIRYEARLRAVLKGGSVNVRDGELFVSHADAVTLIVAAATNFVGYKDVSGDAGARVESAMQAASGLSFENLETAHIAEHRRLFRRVSITLPATRNSTMPTDERLRAFDGTNDPALAALLFQFGRYVLISSSRPGGQPANLQGIWNKDMSPAWDAKYTTNINTEMNYWPAEPANLNECAEPLFRMIRELTDQGSATAREYYGARGWVHHQNTDLWRVTAPMDGPSWGAFTTGGAWLATHLWEHYLYTGDKEFLREYYPVLKGSAEFFLDFLRPEPKHGWLVTNPSTSPENFPAGPANERFFDEITTFMTGTTLTAGSTIDMQILRELFGAVADAADTLGVDPELRNRVLEARSKLAPMQIGRKGNLQEWLDDWDETEKSHRHISGLWGLYPGHQISPRLTPELAEASRVVLEQRGLTGNGWSSAWKAACWARLENGDKALENIRYAVGNYTTASLFSICSNAMQVDGALGMTAAIAEMLLQSNAGEIQFLPALPSSWNAGEVRGLRARGGFELDFRWDAGRLRNATILSHGGQICRVRMAGSFALTHGGKPVAARRPQRDVIEFQTAAGEEYALTRVD
jgi:alpha-L-fucosidase 2